MSTPVRKPDRPFYRHPRYDDVKADYKDGDSVSSKKATGRQDSHRGFNDTRNTRPRNAPTSRGGRGFTRTNLSKRNEGNLTMPASNISQTASPKYHDSTSQRSVTAAEPNPRGQSVVSPPSTTGDKANTSASSVKHGGLIHLPKDIHIYEDLEESKSNAKSGKREGHGTGRPVVVVRPSFSRTSRFSESETFTRGTGQSDQSLLQDSSHLKVAKTPASGHIWDDSTEAAFQFFLRSFNQSQHDPDVAIPQPPGASHTAGSMHPPNEAVLAAVQQIVQLDSTLNSLLVPPGMCASSLSQLRVSSIENEEVKTEPERLLLRWWYSVQQFREALFTLFESVILTDLDFCNTAHVEQGMWKSVFYAILELLRSWISNPDGMGFANTPGGRVDGVNAKLAARLQRICLQDIITAGEARLQTLLERIQAVYRTPLAGILSDGRPPPETRSRSRRLVYLSCQKLMLFLGDLARYKELLVGERNFGKARSWYQKAQLLIPKNGRSYNQLAVLAVYTSRPLDAMYFYIRTLAASNPFSTASQSLSALFNEVTPRAESLIRQIQKPKNDNPSSRDTRFGTAAGKFQRVEIWIHPVDGQTTVIQGTRRLVYPPSHPNSKGLKSELKSAVKGRSETDAVAENDEDEDEEAQAELEEYANTSLIELSKQFGLTFIHAHGKLFTKIGMETFPEVASLALQALSGLLAQNPCPLSPERLCHLCIVNMYNVDRAMSMTSHANNLGSSTADAEKSALKLQPIGRLTGVETLRSVHHDHAARFALDMFSLLCRRAAQLLQQTPPPSNQPWSLPSDVRLILPALRLWSEWMILHPEHWLPPPNHRDPTLRPYLNDWQLVAEFCTRAAAWLAQSSTRPEYEELTPTTSLVSRLKGDSEDTQTSETSGSIQNAAFLFEESLCAGFKPMLDLVPKLYRYTGNLTPEAMADFVRIDKLVLFGDFLCGIDSPVLQYDVDRATYESVIERESSERVQDKETGKDVESPLVKGRSSSESDNTFAPRKSDVEECPIPKAPVDTEPSADILELQQQRAMLQRQLEEEQRLATWRRNAIKQAASGGRRAVELEVRPIYLLPDTNCYIDWLEGIATLAQRSSNYTVLVPIVVVNELDALARPSGKSSRTEQIYDNVGDNEVTRAGLIQERARAAIAYLENEFAHRNSRLRALTAKGSFLETIAYRTEINGGRESGQINDDVILTCCTHFCKEDPDRFRASQGLDQNTVIEPNNQPIRITREIVLLTSDRNLRLKALNINLPARPLRTFVSWSRLPLVTQLSNAATEPVLNKNDRKEDFPKLKPRGQWKQPLKHRS